MMAPKDNILTEVDEAGLGSPGDVRSSKVRFCAIHLSIDDEWYSKRLAFKAP